MTSDPKLLLVEDNEQFGERLRQALQSPEGNWASTTIVSRFETVWVKSVAEAQEQLHEAEVRLTPFDVVILDLKLPAKPNGEFLDRKAGLEVLRRRSPHGAAAVVVASDFDDMDLIRGALDGGADDYVLKRLGTEEIYRSAVAAFRKGQARQEAGWLELRQRRQVHWQRLQACAQFADRLGCRVSDGIGEVLAKADELARLLKDHFHLNLETDADNPICRALCELQTAAVSTTKSLAGERSRLGSQTDGLTRVDLRDLLNEAVHALWEGIVYRRLQWSPLSGTFPIDTFAKEARSVIEEMLFFILEASRDRMSLRAEIRQGHESATLNLTATGMILDEDDCRKINESQLVGLEAGPAWGLSLAQRAARNIGARLSIRPVSDGTTVSFHIAPANENGTPPHRR